MVKRIAIDSMILIYLLEGSSKYVDKIKDTLCAVDEIVLSSLGLAEIITGFERTNDEKSKLQFLSFIHSNKKICINSFGKNEALQFAILRGKYNSLKAPDAIHLATAICSNVDAFVTNDKALQKIAEMSVIGLD